MAVVVVGKIDFVVLSGTELSEIWHFENGARFFPIGQAQSHGHGLSVAGLRQDALRNQDLVEIP
jgi:hypothetical protein